MRRFVSALLIGQAILLIAGSPALAKGRIVPDLEAPVPARITAGDPLRVEFALRWDGTGPVSVADVVVTARPLPDGPLRRFDARPQIRVGGYVAELRLPAGRWALRAGIMATGDGRRFEQFSSEEFATVAVTEAGVSRGAPLPETAVAAPGPSPADAFHAQHLVPVGLLLGSVALLAWWIYSRHGIRGRLGR